MVRTGGRAEKSRMIPQDNDLSPVLAVDIRPNTELYVSTDLRETVAASIVGFTFSVPAGTVLVGVVRFH